MEHRTLKTKIYVANLPYETDNNALEKLFLPFGNIKKINIIIDFTTGKSRGFAFITYVLPEAAARALTLGGQIFQGRKLFVKIAQERHVVRTKQVVTKVK